MSSQLISELRKSLADVSEQLRTLAILGAQTKCCFKPQMDILTTRRETLTHEIEVEEEKEKKMMELKVFDATTEDAAYLRGFREGRQKGFEEGQKSGFKFQDGFPPK